MIAKQQLEDSLNEILTYLVRLRRPVVRLIQDGLPLSTLHEIEQTLPFLLTDEIITLYQWRNGIAEASEYVLGDLNFFPGFYFLSIEEAVTTYLERRDSEQWRVEWFPVFADGAGDFYVIPCSPVRLESAAVVGFIHGEPEQYEEYINLSAMLKTIAACYAQGGYFLDDENFLVTDEERQSTIARQFNPGVAVWQE